MLKLILTIFQNCCNTVVFLLCDDTATTQKGKKVKITVPKAKGGSSRKKTKMKRSGVVVQKKDKKGRRKKGDSDASDEEADELKNDPHANGHVEIDGNYNELTQLTQSVSTGLATL